jgi:hypothetical protein
MNNLITGNKFKKICDYSYEGNLIKHHNFENKCPIFFVKTNLIEIFFKEFNFNKQFKIITHNSDHSINNNHLIYLENEKLIKWFAQNTEIQHKKLEPIPIGIANEIWESGNESLWIDFLKKDIKKDSLFYCNFTINNNRNERELCFKKMCEYNISKIEYKKFNEYLYDLSKSFFSICPNGNGIDTHRLWESLYLKTIPIVTKSNLTEYFQSLYPIIVIDNWNEFDKNNYSEDLYYNIIKNHNYKFLDFDFYEKKIKFL